MIHRWFLRSLLTMALAPLLAAAAAPVQSADEPPDDDERAYAAAIARRSLRENCLMCHSEEMIVSQRLTPAQWKAEVEKMIGWGSPLPKEQQQSLVDYLSAQYSDRTPPAAPARITLRDALARVAPQRPSGPDAPGDPGRGARAFATNCASCHGRDGQGAELGTNLVEKPVLLRPADFREVLRTGRGRMPSSAAALRPGDALDILAWLRLQRYRPPVVK